MLQAQAKGASLMQPLAKVSLAELISPAFAMLSAADVAPDTAYFHKFYEVKAKREAAGVRPKGKRKKRAAEGEGPLTEDDEDSLADSDAGSEEVGELGAACHVHCLLCASSGCRCVAAAIYT